MLSMQVKLAGSALFQEIGGEAVMLDLASSTYFGLNQVGARCWQLLQDKLDMTSAFQRLLQEYEVDAVQLEQDLQQLWLS